MIQLMGLEGAELSYLHQLSGGMQQRVGIGRALISNPNILLMDEPFSALDILTSKKLHNLLKQIRNKYHNTTIIATHNVEEAMYLCDRILILSSSPVNIIDDIDITYLLEHNREDVFNENFSIIGKYIEKNQLKVFGFYNILFF